MIELERRQYFKIILGAALTVGTVTAYMANNIFFVQTALLENVLVAKVFFTSVNIVLLTALTHNYFRIYQEVPTSMSRGLAIFSGALLLYALTSSPILHAAAGFETIRIGIFTYVPDMFVSIAATIILYESYK